MGGGLAFLNKKGWHPGSLRNMEKVWAKEQEHDAEQRKLEEMKEQIEQERQQEEMRGLARKAGLKQDGSSMDWMYRGGIQAMPDTSKQTDEMAAADPASIGEQAPHAQVQLPSFLAEDTPASANEVWVRLHNDPLFAIKQQEIAARKTVLANPVKMDAIKKQADLAVQQKASRKQAKKDAKAAKKARKQARKRQQGKVAEQDADGSLSSADSDAEQHRAKRRRVHADTGLSAVVQGAHQQASKGQNGLDRRCDSDLTRPSYSSRHRDDSSHNAARDMRHHSNDALIHGHRDIERHRNDRHRAQHERPQHASRSEPRAPDLDKHSELRAAARPAGKTYGLRMSGAVPQASNHQDRTAAIAATRAHLEKAAAVQEEEEKVKASRRHQRKEYKVGRMTEEERGARLAEMTGNADRHEEARWQRLARARRRDQGDDAKRLDDGAAAEAKSHQDYIKATMQEMYGTGSSVEDQIGRRKFYSEKGSDRAAFRR